MPSVAVIMPCFNGAPYLKRALDSVAEQAHPPDEVILIDDGSTDGSVAVAESHPLAGGPLRILHSKAGNGAGTRNVGIAATNCDWLAFLDADDYWLSHHLQQALALIRHPETVAYMAHRRYLHHGQTQTYEGRQPYGIETPTDGIEAAEYVPRYFNGSLSFFMSSTLMRRDRVEAVGAFNDKQIRRHDIELWLRVIAGHRWAFHPRAATVYQIDTPGAISSNLSDREYWFYKALADNADSHPGPDMKALLQLAARRMVVAALTNGTGDDRRRARRLANPVLTPKNRLMMRVAGLCPPLFGWINRMRRRRIQRRRAREVASTAQGANG